MRLTVAVDGRNLLLPEGTGVATYARNVVAASRMLGHEVRIIGATAALRQHSPISRVLRAASGRRRLSEAGNHLQAPDLFRAAHARFGVTGTPTSVSAHSTPDLVHWTYPLPLLWHGIPNIVTIHDLVPITHPELSSINGHRLRKLLTCLIDQAAHVVTVSAHSRAAILHEFGCDPEHVSNLGQPVDLAADLAAASQAPRLCPPGAFVAIGRVETRKNIARLIEAHRQSGVEAPLVLIGPDGDDAAALARIVSASSRVLRIHFAPRPSLIRTLQEARALLFPSLQEGFGLPILEAMAAGTPVLTSAGGATEEIAGGAALLVDPHSTESIAAGIRRLDESAALRTTLSQHGNQRCADFTRAAFAQGVGAVYRRAWERHAGKLDLAGRSG